MGCLPALAAALAVLQLQTERVTRSTLSLACAGHDEVLQSTRAARATADSLLRRIEEGLAGRRSQAEVLSELLDGLAAEQASALSILRAGQAQLDDLRLRAVSTFELRSVTAVSASPGLRRRRLCLRERSSEPCVAAARSRANSLCPHARSRESTKECTPSESVAFVTGVRQSRDTRRFPLLLLLTGVVTREGTFSWSVAMLLAGGARIRCCCCC